MLPFRSGEEEAYMRQKTLLATIATLRFLVGSVFTTVVAASLAAQLDLPIALALSIGLTCLWSLLMWLVAPLIMDLIQRWIYKARNITRTAPQRAPADRRVRRQRLPEARHPRTAPQDDRRPDAAGLLLRQPRQQRAPRRHPRPHPLPRRRGAKAVYAHELGHIVHRDFIVMTIAATLLRRPLEHLHHRAQHPRKEQLAAGYTHRARGARLLVDRPVHAALPVADARVLRRCILGRRDGQPNALSMALVKIAYGLTKREPTPFSQKLMGGTRALGYQRFQAASGGRATHTSRQPSAAGGHQPLRGAGGCRGGGRPQAGTVRRSRHARWRATHREGAAVRSLQSVGAPSASSARRIRSRASAFARSASNRRARAAAAAVVRSRRCPGASARHGAHVQHLHLRGRHLFRPAHSRRRVLLARRSGSLALGMPMLAGGFGGGIVFGIGLRE